MLFLKRKNVVNSLTILEQCHGISLHSGKLANDTEMTNLQNERVNLLENLSFKMTQEF